MNAMRVDFQSRHVDGRRATGRLDVRVSRQVLNSAYARVDDLYFEVPADFHTHNDLVAAALLTLVGTSYQEVSFNFAISPRCAEILRAYYHLEEVGPVDPSLVPRRPGNQLALNFSGGLDSTALWWLLSRHLQAEFHVVTSDYGGMYRHERAGHGTARRAVCCRTNLRELRFDQAGRFNAAVPLLFAEYLDLKGLASGHTLRQEDSDIDSLKDGRPPAFLALEPAYTAGGLAEIHLVRAVHWRALQKVLVLGAPHVVETALRASARPGSDKYYGKALGLRACYEQIGVPLPAYLEDIPPPVHRQPLARRGSNVLQGLSYAQWFGRDVTRPIAPWIDRLDLSVLDRLSFDFLGKYNPNFIHLIPAAFKNGMLDAFHEYGIYPYTERDWHELEVVDEIRQALELT